MCRFSPDSQYIVSGAEDSTVRLWDLQGNQIGTPLQGHQQWITSVAISPDSQYIVSSSTDATLRLWPGGWKGWLQIACDKLLHNPVFENPMTEEAKAAYETCCKYVWNDE